MNYGSFEFPLRARYVRQNNRIYTILDCQDGEVLEYYGKADIPNANAKGYRWYRDSNGGLHLVNISELEEAAE